MDTKIVSTTWELNRPARSEVAGSLRGEGFEFEHELGCPMQGSTQDCTCYVSRIRLVKTPVGKFIPTTEPDLSDSLDMWIRLAGERKDRAEKVQRENNILWFGLVITSVSGLIALSGLVFELGLL